MKLRRQERGAALLTAMVIVTLVATLAAAMVWQQWRAVQAEATERARIQAAWILAGALDWSRLILREDARAGGPDHLGEPWAVPLAEARLSSFLAVDKDNTDDAPEAFLSGTITDAQARYNLRNLFQEQEAKVIPAELAILKRLCEAAGVADDVADRLASALAAANLGQGDAALMPESVAQLAWLGFDADTRKRLAPYVVLLPTRTPVNINTASSEVIAAAVDGLQRGDAEQLVQVRQRTPFRSLAQAQATLPQGITLEPKQVSTTTRYFEVRGRLRLGDRVLVEQSLLERRGANVIAVQRERVNLTDPQS
ncbi:MAG TPA: type II secretion system minor pseudopilin GspK [Burkholderiaceae bacterium]|nr:type II secretion system minor pseudopilin GspK [Burkholderiaceae bacterium]